MPADPIVDADPYIGMVIHGDIEIKSVAGAGAMGRVYRAHQRGIDRDVAVKILHRELSGNTSLVSRFHREAKIASKLQHPHVVEVYLAGQLPDGSLFIVMEYLDGVSLGMATKASAGMMTLERALPIALQLCDAVGEGHARGIVHRDLKPENVMLIRRVDTEDWVKVLDFGIAKVNLGEQSMETAAGLIFGTARYISPEGAQGAAVGPAGDVYSIATILYQLLAGRTPFDAEQPVGLLVKHIHDAPPPLRSWPAAASVPTPIARVIMDNLAKEASARAQSARAFGNALAAAAREANVVFTDVGVVARMSMNDLPPSRRSGAVERTLDDAAAQLVPITPSSKAVSSANGFGDMSADTAPLVVISPQHPTGPPPPVRVVPEPASSARSRRAKRMPLYVVALAFLLGVALTALAMQYLAQRPDASHVAHVLRTQRALAQGNYVEPAGDNVRDLVATGLAQWPDDAELKHIRTDAAREIVMRAMAARSGGDVAGARDLAKAAHDIEPNDATAKLLLAQYEDELTAMLGDAGGAFAGPRVTLDVPIGRARPGGRAELIARITGPTEHVVDAQFVISGPGLAADGVALPPASNNPYRVTFTPPREGTYEVQFEANVDGATVRAARVFTSVR